jgi:hypothetical protein
VEPFDRFPSFTAVFRHGGGVPVPLHMTLVDLGPGADVAIAAIREAGQRSGAGLDEELRALLAEPNWRPQLVGATALLVLGARADSACALWTALDRPCWASPQLAASGQRVDPGFAANARMRVERRCRLDSGGALVTPWPERHSAMGPDSIHAHSWKLLSALIALCRGRLETSAWLEPLLAAADIREMLAKDTTRGGELAVRWLRGMDGLLAEDRLG